MFNLKIDLSLKFTFVISFISIISAYFIEYILGHQPCNLCLIERIPYVISIFLIASNRFFFKNKKFLIILLILIFIFSFGVSAYHFGIEQGILVESSICGLKDASEIVTKDELLKMLNEKTISCKDVTFKIFNLSLTTYNIILSIIMFLISTKIFLINNEIK